MRGQTGGGRTAGHFSGEPGVTLRLQKRKNIKRIAGRPVGRAQVRASAEERERRRGGAIEMGGGERQ